MLIVVAHRVGAEGHHPAAAARISQRARRGGQMQRFERQAGEVAEHQHAVRLDAVQQVQRVPVAVIHPVPLAVRCAEVHARLAEPPQGAGVDVQHGKGLAVDAASAGREDGRRVVGVDRSLMLEQAKVLALPAAFGAVQQFDRHGCGRARGGRGHLPEHDAAAHELVGRFVERVHPVHVLALEHSGAGAVGVRHDAGVESSPFEARVAGPSERRHGLSVAQALGRITARAHHAAGAGTQSFPWFWPVAHPARTLLRIGQCTGGVASALRRGSHCAHTTLLMPPSMLIAQPVM